MAFQKKTWVNRVAQYPLRRLLTIVRNFDATNTAVMDIQREEGEVTTEGDAFSAENMNDLENRIKQGFDDAGGGNFVGVRYHASLVDYPDYPCWEDMTANEKAKYDISTGATINFLDDEAIPDDILGDTDISGIGDGTLTGAISDVDERVSEVDSALSNKQNKSNLTTPVSVTNVTPSAAGNIALSYKLSDYQLLSAYCVSDSVVVTPYINNATGEWRLHCETTQGAAYTSTGNFKLILIPRS